MHFMGPPPQQTPPPPEPDTSGREDLRVLVYRRRRFVELGFDRPRSRMLAESGVDWHQAQSMLRHHATLDQTFRILL